LKNWHSHSSQLPDYFHDFAATFHKKWAAQQKDILAHCRRELVHAVWNLLLDDAFIHAFKYGIVIKCADGVERRVYPRFFTYSADYPEKYVPPSQFRIPADLAPQSFVGNDPGQGVMPLPKVPNPKDKT